MTRRVGQRTSAPNVAPNRKDVLRAIYEGLAHGDIPYWDSSTGVWRNLALGTTGQYLRSDGSDALWAGLDVDDVAAGLLDHEYGGIEADISAVAIGGIIAGTGAGAMGLVTSSGKSDGDVLTLQGDLSAAYETPAGGGGMDPTLINFAQRYLGLVSWWPLDEASGTRADACDAGNDLADNGTVTQGPALGPSSASAEFTRANSEFLSITDGTQLSLEMQGAFTTMGWVEPDDAGLEAFWGKALPAGNQYSWYINTKFLSGTTIEMLYSTNGSSNTVIASPAARLVADTEYWIGFTWDGEYARLYSWKEGETGITLHAITAIAKPFVSTSDFRIGARGDAALYFDGTMAAVSFWNRALSVNELTWWCNDGAGQDIDALMSTF